MEVFKMCDVVRETGFAIHRYLRNADILRRFMRMPLVNRLRKLGHRVAQQHPLEVRDEDGTVLGSFSADLFFEETLVIELKGSVARAR